MPNGNGKGKGKAPALRAGQQKAPKAVGHGAYKRDKPVENRNPTLSSNKRQPKGNAPKSSPAPKVVNSPAVYENQPKFNRKTKPQKTPPKGKGNGKANK